MTIHRLYCAGLTAFSVTRQLELRIPSPIQMIPYWWPLLVHKIWWPSVAVKCPFRPIYMCFPCIHNALYGRVNRKVTPKLPTVQFMDNFLHFSGSSHQLESNSTLKSLLSAILLAICRHFLFTLLPLLSRAPRKSTTLRLPINLLTTFFHSTDS